MTNKYTLELTENELKAVKLVASNGYIEFIENAKSSAKNLELLGGSEDRVEAISHLLAHTTSGMSRIEEALGLVTDETMPVIEKARQNSSEAPPISELLEILTEEAEDDSE